MSAGVVVIGLMLLGQVGSGSGRYSDAGSTNPFSPGATSGNTGGTGLVPIIGSTPPDNRAAPGTTAPSARGTSPFGTSTTPIGSGGTSPPPGVGGATATTPGTPSGTSSPWQVNPSGTSPAQAQTDAAGGLKPAAMMRAMLAAPAGSRFPGSSLSLADAVASGSSRSDQTERVAAYWDLCSSLADYYLGLREQEELRRARGSRAGPAWQQAESELAVRVATSQLAAVASQYRLASLIGMGGSLPLPADIPHCGDYHTRYEEIFAGRPSAEAQQLAQLLPKRYAELQDAGLAVTRAEQWLNGTAGRDNTEGVETLRALELLALRRRAFVQIARDYNRRIARYTELTTPGQVDPNRLVSMLIRTGNTSTATRPGAPASQYNRQSQAAPSLPRTFDDGGGWSAARDEKLGDAELDDAIRQASGEIEADEPPRRERSLLVNPQ